MLVAIVLLTSFTQQEGGQKIASFRLSIDDKLVSFMTPPQRYVLEIYEGTDGSGTPQRLENSTGNFNASLKTNTTYVCLFWADGATVGDNAAGSYDATSLKNVTLNSGKDMVEAFFGKKTIIPSNNTTSNDVVLKRAVAKVNLVAAATVTANADFKVNFSRYTAFNVLTGAVAGSATASPQEVFNSSATIGTLGTFYTFASIGTETTGGTEVMDFVIIYGTQAPRNISFARLSANYTTNLISNFN